MKHVVLVRLAQGAALLSTTFAATTAALSCATVAERVDAKPTSAQHVLDNVDWKKAGDEAFADLRTYIMANTTNPPAKELDGVGGEKVGADALAALLAADGIESQQWQVDANDPRRVTLVARLKAEHAAHGPLCLVSHIDVVTAEPTRWPKGAGPFEGFVAAAPIETALIKDGKPAVAGTGADSDVLYGRGTLDMKGLGLLEVETMRWLKRTNAKLDRDVILLAVADEEVDSAGMRDAVDNHWDELKCETSVNEGGLGVRDAVVDGQTAFTISVAEKGVLWLKMTASGPPGHGSTPVEGRAPGKLLEAMRRISKRVDHPRVDPSIYELLGVIGREAGGVTGFVMQRPTLVDMLVTDRFMEKPVTHAMITNTVNLTGFAGAHEPNVVPSEVYAQYDIRLLPGTKPDDVIAELKDLVGDMPGISFTVMQHPMLAAVSDYSDDPFYASLAHHAVAVAAAHGEKRVVAGPILSPGFTDSIFLRGKGVKAYGFLPFIVTTEDLGGMHGDGEHVSKANVVRGVETLLRAVVDVAVTP